MTAQKLIDKMLAKGFTKSGEDVYTKTVNSSTVKVRISTENRSPLPQMSETTPFGYGCNVYWSPAGLNIALTKRKYY